MIFFFVAIALVVVLHWYLWRRLIADTMRPGIVRRIATAVFCLLIGLMVVALALGTRVSPDIARWFVWPGYLWLALFFYLLLALAVLEVPRLFLRGWVRRGDDERRERAAVAATDDGAAAGHDDGEGAYADRAASSDEASAVNALPGDPGAGTVPVTSGADGVSADHHTPADAPGAAAAGATRAEKAPRRPISRRTLLARGSAAVAGVTAAGLVGYGTSVAFGPPTIARVPIALSRLDPRAAGCRIALVSDVHVGPIIGRSFTQRIVDMINEEDVDLVAIAGDLIDGDVSDIADGTAPFGELRSAHGTFFVTGNHEYYAGYEQWVEHLPTLGITVLRNERTTIEHNGGRFEFAGINDATGHEWQDPGDVGAAVAGRSDDEAVVLLAHQPVDFDDAVDNDVDLLLAGHTHGGQLSPFELLVTLQQGAVAGVYQRRDTTMFVTNGAGFWGPPSRVGARPEISIIELTTMDPFDDPTEGDGT